MTSRRELLRALGALGTASVLPAAGWADAGSPAYLAAAKQGDGYVLLGLAADGAETFRLPLPDRGHAAAAHPVRPEAVAFARRPGTFAIVIDCAAGREAARLTAPEGRHFYGHGAFTADGRLLFTTENAIAEGEGRLGIWDASDGYRRLGEVPSGGIGPHEVLLMPDGRRLAVANGGILTDPSSGRAKLNLATMRPNLAYLDLDGRLLDLLEAPDALRLNSIRHIAAGRDGTLAAALQWEGPATEAPPLLALHRPGAKALEFLAAPEPIQRRTRNYAGSVAVSADGRQAAITAPRGGMMLVFDLQIGSVAVDEAVDVCGVAAGEVGFASTTGTGLLRTRDHLVTFSNVAFDNHLIRVISEV